MLCRRFICLCEKDWGGSEFISLFPIDFFKRACWRLKALYLILKSVIPVVLNHLLKLSILNVDCFGWLRDYRLSRPFLCYILAEDGFQIISQVLNLLKILSCTTVFTWAHCCKEPMHFRLVLAVMSMFVVFMKVYLVARLCIERWSFAFAMNSINTLLSHVVLLLLKNLFSLLLVELMIVLRIYVFLWRVPYNFASSRVKKLRIRSGRDKICVRASSISFLLRTAKNWRPAFKVLAIRPLIFEGTNQTLISHKFPWFSIRNEVRMCLIAFSLDISAQNILIWCLTFILIHMDILYDLLLTLIELS